MITCHYYSYYYYYYYYYPRDAMLAVKHILIEYSVLTSTRKNILLLLQ